MTDCPNWVKILLDLRMAGISTRKASVLLEIPRGTVQALMYGHEPRYSTGVKLLELHKQHYQMAEIST